jgi:hypothetical protein
MANRHAHISPNVVNNVLINLKKLNLGCENPYGRMIVRQAGRTVLPS